MLRNSIFLCDRQEEGNKFRQQYNIMVNLNGSGLLFTLRCKFRVFSMMSQEG